MLDPLPSPFYRVTAKALIFDATNQLLIIRNRKGNWELPGGGWEHNESCEDCIRREIDEELGVEVETIGRVQFMYRRLNPPTGATALRIAMPVVLASHNFTIGEDMQEVRFVSRAQFLELNFLTAEGNIADYIDTIWS